MQGAGVMVLGSFRTAFTALVANKTRSLLSVLGIVIGVSAVIMMLAMGRGVETAVANSIRKLGVNLVFIHPTTVAKGGSSARSTQAQSLKVEDVRALKPLPFITRAVPDITLGFQVKFGTANTAASVVGTWPDYPVLRNYAVAQGRFFLEGEERARRNVCVLGSAVARELFASTDPLEQWIKIDRQNFRVVGVMEEKGARGIKNFDESVYIPLSSVSRLSDRTYLTQIIVSVDDPDHVDAVIEAMTAVFRRIHRIPADRKPDVGFASMTEILSKVGEVTGAFTVLLAGIAVLSLLVGGIGIMNIMLVSVTERTREIGLRKAVGARRSDIKRQFLIESVVISLAGGSLGVLLGIGGVRLVEMIPIWEQMFNSPMRGVVMPGAVMLAFCFSCAVGIFFGYFPAVKASRMNPVDALRWE